MGVEHIFSLIKLVFVYSERSEKLILYVFKNEKSKLTFPLFDFLETLCCLNRVFLLIQSLL